MRSLVAGNWKMNGRLDDARERARALCAKAQDGMPCDVVVCPPATLIAPLAAELAQVAIGLGAQDCHAEDSGAFTGDIAAPMLAELGCTHVIVGHSERRRDHSETDALVAAKASAAHRAGLVAIICLGESAEERQEGRAREVVATQLAGSLPAEASSGNTVIAYEPVWAIGTGNTATPDDVAEIHDLLRNRLTASMGDDGAQVRLLYGGSVNAGNADQLLSVPHVNGALVGGASLKPDDFWAIVAAGSPS
jgi:triosephosphate isomerase